MDNSLQQAHSKLTKYFEENKYRSYELKIVPSNYYDQSLEWRAEILKSPSISYLCKTILMENTNFENDKESPTYQKYVCVIIQYITRINSEKVMKWARSLNQNKLGKTKFHYRLAPEDVAYELTGYTYNSLTPYCMNKNIPLIISNKIIDLPGQFFWIGGAHVDIKLRIGVQECVDKYPDSVYFADVVYDD